MSKWLGARFFTPLLLFFGLLALAIYVITTNETTISNIAKEEKKEKVEEIKASKEENKASKKKLESAERYWEHGYFTQSMRLYRKIYDSSEDKKEKLRIKSHIEKLLKEKEVTDLDKEEIATFYWPHLRTHKLKSIR